MSNTPLISVLLPIYNAELYLKESIDSILNQTYTNFELLLLNDGSTDKSEEICLSYTDKRIKYLKHNNIGLAATLNKGISLSLGKYIARQDNDDISLPTRFEKQILFLENNPDVYLLGTCAKIFSNKEPNYGYHNHPTLPAILKFDLLFDNPFVHSSVMFLKTKVLEIGCYQLSRDYYEDHNLWSRFSFVGKVANLPEQLINYRHHDKGLSKINNYYSAKPLYNQTLHNIQTLLNNNNHETIELSKLYHHQYTKNDKFNFPLILSTLNKINETLINEFPNSKNELNKRHKLYKKVFQSRYNMMLRKKENITFLNLLFLKIEHKLLNYKSTIYS